jgi:preprotein translocase SecY subunit
MCSSTVLDSPVCLILGRLPYSVAYTLVSDGLPMVISRGGKTPSAQETFLQMAQAAGLRGRILVTLGLLLICRLGIAVPLPGIDRARFTAALQGNNLGGVISFLDTFSGGGLSTLGVFALGILPFINASIIIQLLTAALPTLEDLQKNEGEAGRRKIAQISRYVSLGWGLLQGTAIALWINSFSVTPGPIFIAQTVLALTAGSMFVMWVSELITERGVGNGASLLIFVNIVATLPKSLANTISLAQNDKNMVGGVVLLGLVFLLTIVGIIFIQEGTRRIPIVSARRQVGRRMYAEKSSYLPLRLNQGGVMPIIFSSTVLMLPAYLTQVVKDQLFATQWSRPLGLRNFLCVVDSVLQLLLLVADHQPHRHGPEPQENGVQYSRHSTGQGDKRVCGTGPQPADFPRSVVLSCDRHHPNSRGRGDPSADVPRDWGDVAADFGGRGDRHVSSNPDLCDFPALRRHGETVGSVRWVNGSPTLGESLHTGS